MPGIYYLSSMSIDRHYGDNNDKTSVKLDSSVNSLYSVVQTTGGGGGEG